MKIPKIFIIYIVSSFIWLALCLLVSIYFLTSLSVKILQGYLALALVFVGIQTARNASEKMLLPKWVLLSFLSIAILAILNIYYWTVEQSSFRPATVSVIYLFTGSGLIVLMAIALIFIFVDSIIKKIRNRRI